MDEMQALDLCAGIEMKCAEIYRKFEMLYADLPEIASLWRKTALEEDNHAEQFKLAYRLRGKGIGEVKVDCEKIEALMQEIESCMDKIESVHPQLTSALRLAIRLEDTLSDFHMLKAVEFKDPELSKLFAAMMDNDRGHVTMLENALAKLTDTI
jgi:rubrerythrin